MSLLQIRAKLYHKLGTFLLPIGASVITKLGQLHLITNWGKRITNWGSFMLQYNKVKKSVIICCLSQPNFFGFENY